jgi:type II secretory pathway pseudopilin PulG
MKSLNLQVHMKCNRNNNRNFFNMVEVTLAIAIIGIGISGVMALFPVGINANASAIANNYCANAAAEFLHFVKIQSDLNPGALTSLPDEAADLTDPGKDHEDVRELLPDWIGNAKVDGFDSIYKIDESKGVYGIVQMTTIAGTDVVDFSAVFRLWKSDVAVPQAPTTDFNWPDPWGKGSVLPAPAPKIYGINIEASWPASKPYDAREKKLFYMTVQTP